MSTAYDTFSRVQRTTYPTGFAVLNSYNTRGDLLEVRDAANDTVFWSIQAENARAQATAFRLGSGLDTLKSFDAEGHLSLVTTGFDSGSAVQNQQFTYDTHGNLSRRVDYNQTPFSGSGQPLSELFFYDALFRLKTATLVGIGARSYSYDPLGNLKSKTGVGSYTYGQNGAGPHAVTAVGGLRYRYDANGNQTGGAGRTITYTSFNKAGTISRAGVTYTYDYGADHHRIRQTGPGHSTVYINPRLDSGAHFESERRGPQVEDKHYIYANGEVVALHVQTHPASQSANITATTRYLHSDHLGSIVAITDEAGQLLESFGYSPFGARRSANGSTPTGILTSTLTHHGYTGHEMLDDFGLIHANARLYDPKLGRFLNADPTIQFPGNLQSYNRYSYTLNNPLSFTDPSGLGLFSKIKKKLKKLFRKKLFRITVAIALSVYTFGTTSAFLNGLFIPGGQVTAAVAAGAAAGFSGGLVITGGNVNASLKLAAAGALTAGTLQAFSSSSFSVRLAGNSLAGGTSSKFLGGSFRKGAALAALTVSASELVTRVTKGIRPTLRTASGEPVLKRNPDAFDCSIFECDVGAPLSPNTGAGVFASLKDTERFRSFINRPLSEAVAAGFREPGFFAFAENNPVLMFLAKVVPGVNSASVFHDKLFGQFERAYPAFTSGGENATLLGGITLRASIPPAFAFDSLALGVPQIRENARLVTDGN